MAAQIAAPGIVRSSPLSTATFSGSGLTGGAGASAVLQGQGTSGTATLTLDADFAVDGSSVSFPVPDGAVDGPVLVTASDGTTATGRLQVQSQYVFAQDYIGEGVDVTTGFAPGELDAILRRASAYADAYIGQSLRLMPHVSEQHTWRGPNEDERVNTRIWPFCWPIVSVDSFVVRISTTQYATFPASDVVINSDQRYVEILSYAVASFTLLGAIQNLGLVANIVQLSYTSGYPIGTYPPTLQEAVTMIATELLTYRAIQRRGFGGLSSVKQGQQIYQRRNETFAIPQPARELLRPFKQRMIV